MMDRFSFETQGVHTYLVYALGGAEQQDALGLGMLGNNKITGLLPLVYTQMDQNRFFKYDVSSRIDLKQLFSDTVKRKMLLSVFRSIAAALLGAEDYMLDSARFLLDPEYIFVDLQNYTAHLVYLPLAEVPPQKDLRSFCKELMFSTQFDQSENTEYVTAMINFLNGKNNFAVEEFLQLLTGLLDENPAPAGPARPAPARPAPAAPARPAPVAPARPAPVAPARPAPVAPVRPAPPVPPAPPRVTQPAAPEKPAPTAPEKPTFDIPGLTPAPEEEKSHKTAIRFWGKKEKAEKPEKPKHSLGWPKKAAEPEEPGFALPGNQTWEQPAAPSVPTPPANDWPMPPAGVTSNYGETTVLGGGAGRETSLLSPDMQPGNAAAPVETPKQPSRAYLVRKSNGEKITLNKSNFFLGADKSYVDYCISDNQFVGGNHAKISLRDGAYFVTDINSRNHSYLDEEQLIPNNEVPLKDGAHLRLATEEFEFFQR